MARSVFFSFHYEDVSSFRANVVRQSWVTMKDRKAVFLDKSLWEEAEKKGVIALKQLIGNSLVGTSVTIVLVGSETSTRRYVKYEIVKSFVEGKGLMAIHINRIKARNGGIIARGSNPFERIGLEVSKDYRKILFYELIDRKWVPYNDLPELNNRKKNSISFPEYSNGLAEFFNVRTGYGGKFYKFSELFKQEYDWVTDKGYGNVNSWIETAFKRVNPE